MAIINLDSPTAPAGRGIAMVVWHQSELGGEAMYGIPARPNILLMLVDEERYPPVYENPEIREWRLRSFAAQRQLRAHALEFHRHYIGSSACCPSRATLLTGQYPSLHGVSQTTGLAKEPFDSDMFWLNRNTVPTLGDWFREAGYDTYYKGKWHISYEDIVVPGTHDAVPSYDPITGVPVPERGLLYANADRLNDFGFSGWIGPEPHGPNPRNSGSSAAAGLSGRDEVYAAELEALIASLDRRKREDPAAKPWLAVASFVNPHDIVLYGSITARLPMFRFETGPMPEVAPPPTMNEPLDAKPRCQASYRDIYPRALQPILERPFYRKLYYQLQMNADLQMRRVLSALARSSCYEDTIVVFTSDHGELLGAHGDLHQKWYCAYEEALRVPLLVHNPRLFPQPRQCEALTSHVDLLPTLLGLASIDAAATAERLRSRFSEVRPFPGRDLAPFIRGLSPAPEDGAIYFMTDDDVTRGQHQTNPFLFWVSYPSVIQPNHVETVMTFLGGEGPPELWKLSRYFDNPRFWSEPGVRDIHGSRVKTRPEPDEYELYNISRDPWETRNLAHPAYASPQSRRVQAELTLLLDEQRRRKRLYPSAGGGASSASGAFGTLGAFKF